MKSYKTEHVEREVIQFELDGVTFEFTPPKSSKLVMGMVQADNADEAGFYATRDMFNWLGLGLSDEQGQLLLDRLNDPEDDLDLDVLGEIVKDLVAEASNRPTKRPSG